jgi:predicted RNA-binding protein with PIN domain
MKAGTLARPAWLDIEGKKINPGGQPIRTWTQIADDNAKAEAAQARLVEEFAEYVAAAGYDVRNVGDAEECALDDRFSSAQKAWFRAFSVRWERTTRSDYGIR